MFYFNFDDIYRLNEKGSLKSIFYISLYQYIIFDIILYIILYINISKKKTACFCSDGQKGFPREKKETK